jgi:hypothetical protein
MSRRLLGAVSFVMAAACNSVSPPPSRFPDAESALARMRASQACSRGVSMDSKLDYFGEGGRVRGSVLGIASMPDRIRFDVFSPFGATLSTLTSDGRRFSLYDLREKVFLYGPANACNLQRFTRVPLPPHAFVELLRGVAPVLVHAPGSATLSWEGESYSIRIPSKHQAEEEIRLRPPEADWELPWEQQRVRVVAVTVRQAGVPLYRVELEGHKTVKTAATQVDPDGIDPPVPPSGPECSAELPHRLRFVVADGEHDVVLASGALAHNPPLVFRAFEQDAPPGVRSRPSACE